MGWSHKWCAIGLSLGTIALRDLLYVYDLPEGKDSS